MKSEVKSLTAYLFLVELSCFPVQCLEESGKKTITSLCGHHFVCSVSIDKTGYLCWLFLNGKGFVGSLLIEKSCPFTE